MISRSSFRTDEIQYSRWPIWSVLFLCDAFFILLSLELIITAQGRRVFIILAVFLNNRENRLIDSWWVCKLIKPLYFFFRESKGAYSWNETNYSVFHLVIQLMSFLGRGSGDSSAYPTASAAKSWPSAWSMLSALQGQRKYHRSTGFPTQVTGGKSHILDCGSNRLGIADFRNTVFFCQRARQVKA